ncbi:MAG: acyl-CoA dehydrogenase family protein [Azospirillaceae bacterium]|nr:acyl-CoA dehydrogenase family protein [Azospirillaceae bacterium]
MTVTLSDPTHRAALAELKHLLAATAVERDRAGGTAKTERDAIRRSGLLTLAVPPGFGGAGETWPAILGAVRALAQVDSSLAHLFAFQHLMVASVLLYGSAAQRDALLTETVRKPLFWGNALNPLDRRTTLTPAPQGWTLDGTKSFCSGASDSDMLLVSADDPDGRLRVFVIPTRRPGVAILDDWDNMGQRQTDSGTVTFSGVPVDHDEILGPPGPFGGVACTLRPLIAQAILAAIYLGIGEGALAAAREFTLGSARPWRSSGVTAAAEDPYVLHHYGELHVGLAGAAALGDQATARLQAAWEKRDELSPAERGQVAVAIATAKVAATRAGLDATNRLFDVTGARATGARYGLDRFWRNLRTHSLHDPVDYKLKELGAWALNGTVPQPDFYS